MSMMYNSVTCVKSLVPGMLCRKAISSCTVSISKGLDSISEIRDVHPFVNRFQQVQRIAFVDLSCHLLNKISRIYSWGVAKR